MSKPAISKIVNGTATPRPQNALAIARALGVNPSDLFDPELATENDKRTRVVSRPIPLLTIGEIATLVDGTVGRENVTPSQWLPEVPFADCSDKTIVAVRAEDRALSPTISIGDLLYVRGFTFLDAKAEPKAKEGDYVLALAKGVQRPIVRMYVRGDVGGDWLISENMDYPGEKKLQAEKILGVVVAKACILLE